MDSSRIAVLASFAALALWVADSVAIWFASGQQSSIDGALFFAGLACQLLAVVAIGLTLGAGRPALHRALAAVGAVAVTVAVAILTNVLVALVQPVDPGWACGEVNLWVLALLAVAAATWVARRHHPSPARQSPV